MEKKYENNNDLNLKATELRLGLPGTYDESDQQSSSSVTNKRSSSEMENSCEKTIQSDSPAPKGQVIGWPPVRSYRKSIMKQKMESDGSGMFVKVSMDGAPFLRKIDLKLYKNYFDLLKALEKMFKCSGIGYSGSEYVLTYEDKDEDWLLVGDVPWNMFSNSCKRMRIMNRSEVKGLGCL